jgi:hypothetical protein
MIIWLYLIYFRLQYDIADHHWPRSQFLEKTLNLPAPYPLLICQMVHKLLHQEKTDSSGLNVFIVDKFEVSKFHFLIIIVWNLLFFLMTLLLIFKIITMMIRDRSMCGHIRNSQCGTIQRACLVFQAFGECDSYIMLDIIQLLISDV